MEKKQSKWIWKTVVAACIAASILSYMCIPSVKDMMNKIVTMFATGDFGVVREFVASYGNYAAAVSFGLMVLSLSWRLFRPSSSPLPTRISLDGGREQSCPGPVPWQAPPFVFT